MSTTNILKLAIIHDSISEQNKLNNEIIYHLVTAYNGRLLKIELNQFKVPCAAECGDTSCLKELNCDLIEYQFVDDKEMVRCGNGLHLFEPVVGVSYTVYHEVSPYFWNRFEQDENLLDKQEKMN